MSHLERASAELDDNEHPEDCGCVECEGPVTIECRVCEYPMTEEPCAHCGNRLGVLELRQALRAVLDHLDDHGIDMDTHDLAIARAVFDRTEPEVLRLGPDWMDAAPLLVSRCHAGKDGDCEWSECPQVRDGEPV